MSLYVYTCARTSGACECKLYINKTRDKLAKLSRPFDSDKIPARGAQRESIDFIILNHIHTRAVNQANGGAIRGAINWIITARNEPRINVYSTAAAAGGAGAGSRSRAQLK